MNDKQQLAAMGEHVREMEECKPGFNVPDGWKLVPVEPTKEVLSIGGLYPDSYASMLAAAPEYKP